MALLQCFGNIFCNCCVLIGPQKLVSRDLFSMLGHHLWLWINMNPALGHRSYWCAVSVSTIHWPNIGSTLVHCLRHRPNIRKTLGRCRPIVFTLWDWQWWINASQSSTTLAHHKINIDHSQTKKVQTKKKLQSQKNPSCGLTHPPTFSFFSDLFLTWKNHSVVIDYWVNIHFVSNNSD